MIKLIHFYKRDYQPEYPDIEAAKAALENKRLNSNAECYTQVWDMSSETGGIMIGFYEDGVEADLVIVNPAKSKAKITKP
jgi:hypothetical protein